MTPRWALLLFRECAQLPRNHPKCWSKNNDALFMVNNCHLPSLSTAHIWCDGTKNTVQENSNFKEDTFEKDALEENPAEDENSSDQTGCGDTQRTSEYCHASFP